MCSHKYTLCEIPLTGKSHCLSDAGPRHVLQWLYIEVIIVGFQALSSILPLFFSVLTAPVIFFSESALRPDSPFSARCPWKGYTHVSFFSILCASCRETKTAWEEERNRPPWLSSGLTRPADSDYMTGSQCDKESEVVRRGKAWKIEIAIEKNSFGQIDVSMSLKSLMSCCPTSIASLYFEGTHYFFEKEGFPIWPGSPGPH